MTPKPQAVIHLLDNSLTHTWCGLDSTELRLEVTGLAHRATCDECRRRDLDQMYRNYEENTRPPLRGNQP